MPVSIQGSFHRSVHLSRDVYGDGAHHGYIVTAKAREVVGRVADALAAPVAQRAWSVTGPYGGGKSAFALFLSGLLCGDATATERLAAADAGLAERLDEVRGGTFCPVLVVGSREALVPALLRGLAEGLDAFVANQSSGRPSDELRDTLGTIASRARASVTESQGDAEAAVLDLVDQAARAVHAATGGGVLLIVDELGKMLEHAALYPDATDLFALQRLAERASRAPAGGQPAPLLLFTILHQAFDRYAGRLGGDDRDEWRKIQGRFEDVAFVAPVGETLRLLAQAVQATPDAIPDGAAELPGRVVALADLPAGADAAEVERHLDGALPLHPAVGLLVGPLFRRLAQNERSLFAFLASGETGGFLDVAGDGGTVYRLDHLYDYLIANLGATLFSERMERLWAETEATLSALPDADALTVRLVKHVAVLGFAGGLAGLQATADVLAVTTGETADAVRQSLDGLRERRALTFRPFGETYHVWQGSAFDLSAALRQAREAVPQRTPLADLLRQSLPPRPAVARRHSYRTGTPRVFAVAYASDTEWRSVVAQTPKRADGQIVYVLPEGDQEAQQIVDQALAADLSPLTLVAVPDNVGALRETAHGLACLDWVRAHAPEMAGDAAARREVDEQRAAVAAEVERRLSALLQAGPQGENPCTWVRDGESFRIAGERALQTALSDACDQVFAHAPEVWNELLNRRRPSPSAIRGLKLLLAAMLGEPDQPRLGIEGTPAEYGMYASVLQATGLHRETADGWGFARPDDRPGCAAVWDAVAETLRQGQGRPVPVADIYGTLAAPPYGVRPGLVPVFLLAFAVHDRDRVAFFENGAFVRDLTFETVERLLKSAEKGQGAFAVQFVEVDAERASLLAALAPLLGLPASTDQPLPLVIRLLGRVHDLPPFVRKTAELSERVGAARGALERATDPAALLFDALPRALGAGSFLDGDGDRQRYADRLQDALRELGGAYDVLLADLDAQVARAFRLRASDADGRRRELADRARLLLPVAQSLSLKAFLVRASDQTLATRAWTESLAALLARTPPAQWTDSDRAAFAVSLAETARAFHRLEPLAMDAAEDEGEASSAVRRVRLSVQTLRESEHGGVVHVHPEDDALVDQLHADLADAARQSGATPDVQLAALSQLVTDLLAERDAIPTDQPHE